MPKEIPLKKIKAEAKAVRGLTEQALKDSKGARGGLKAARERDRNRVNAITEQLLADLLSDPSAIPPEVVLPTVEEELMALKMPSDTPPDLKQLDDNELHDYVQPLIHPDALAYLKKFPDKEVGEAFMYLGTGNIVTVRVNVDRPRQKTLAVLNHLLSIISDRKPGWNVCQAPDYLSAWNSGRGKSDKPTVKAMRRKKAAGIIQGANPGQFKAPGRGTSSTESVVSCNECREVSDCPFIKKYAGRLCDPLEEALKKSK